jgi:hypothetical protein
MGESNQKASKSSMESSEDLVKHCLCLALPLFGPASGRWRGPCRFICSFVVPGGLLYHGDGEGVFLRTTTGDNGTGTVVSMSGTTTTGQDGPGITTGKSMPQRAQVQCDRSDGREDGKVLRRRSFVALLSRCLSRGGSLPPSSCHEKPRNGSCSHL